MRTHISFMKEAMDSFVAFMEASDRWCDNYDQNLYLFDLFLFNKHGTATILTDEMVSEWCSQRPSECSHSTYTRIKAIIAFLKYLNRRGISDIVIPESPKHERRNYIPHHFTEEELQRFFHECDIVPPDSRANKKDSERCSLVIPVFFRLLYSSGIRTTEARLLSRDEADLENGVLNIKKSKGYGQHYVALHDSMTCMLREYNEAMDNILPERIAFFPNKQGLSLNTAWVSHNFRKLWDKANPGIPAVAYDLRHHYAISNINSWVDEGFSVNDKLVCLSRSMGHCSVDSTSYYYSLVPNLANILEEHSGMEFSRIVKEDRHGKK